MPSREAPTLADPSLKPWAFESREFLRALAVGKPVTFTVTHSLPPNEDVPRDIGTAQIGDMDLASELIRNGWAKIKDMKREPTEDDLRKRDLEKEASTQGKGLWNPHGPKARAVHYMMPTDSQGFISEWKGRPLDGMHTLEPISYRVTDI